MYTFFFRNSIILKNPLVCGSFKDYLPSVIPKEFYDHNKTVDYGV